MQCMTLHVFLTATLIKWFCFNKVVALSKKINHPTQPRISPLSINIYIPNLLPVQDKQRGCGGNYIKITVKCYSPTGGLMNEMPAKDDTYLIQKAPSY